MRHSFTAREAQSRRCTCWRCRREPPGERTASHHCSKRQIPDETHIHLVATNTKINAIKFATTCTIVLLSSCSSSNRRTTFKLLVSCFTDKTLGSHLSHEEDDFLSDAPVAVLQCGEQLRDDNARRHELNGRYERGQPSRSLSV